MTTRLKNAIQQLPPEKVEQVTAFAESLVLTVTASNDSKDQYLALDWVGKAAHLYPEHRSGVEAAHAAAEMWRKSAVEPGEV